MASSSPLTTSHTNKRLKIDNDLQLNNAQSFTRFWMVQATDFLNPLSKLSVFSIQKGFHALLGCDPKNIRSLRSGDLLVEVDTISQARCIEKCSKVHTVPVKTSPHRTLNTSKGIVRHEALRQGSVEEILDSLRETVCHVHRFTRIKDGTKVPTGTIVVTFKSPNAPEKIKMGYLNLKVETYIPNPLRCFNCQKYGHGRTSCKRRSSVCGKCGQQDHEELACQEEKPKCANCEGSHPAYSKSCPLWVKEKEVQKVKATQNISFPEARKIVDAKLSSGPTYASKTATTDTKTMTKSVGTQTNDASCQTNHIPSTITIACQTDHSMLNHQYP